MRNNGNIYGTIPVKEGFFKVNLSLIKFEEDGCKIAYCPALEISGYGNNDEEAIESFKISLSEFFKYTSNKKSFEKEMERMGWTISRAKNKSMIPPSMIKLLQENDNFSRIFNEHSFYKEDLTIDLPIAV
jgi:hypothetical protein